MGVRADGRGSKRYVRVPKPEASKKVENLIRSLFITSTVALAYARAISKCGICMKTTLVFQNIIFIMYNLFEKNVMIF
jgi:hypothetical protein